MCTVTYHFASAFEEQSTKVPGIPYRGFALELPWGILSAIPKIPSFVQLQRREL